jgi:hypothetical protein
MRKNAKVKQDKPVEVQVPAVAAQAQLSQDAVSSLAKYRDWIDANLQFGVPKTNPFDGASNDFSDTTAAAASTMLIPSQPVKTTSQVPSQQIESI